MELRKAIAAISVNYPGSLEPLRQELVMRSWNVAEMKSSWVDEGRWR